jgi:hypothetical protein
MSIPWLDRVYVDMKWCHVKTSFSALMGMHFALSHHSADAEKSSFFGSSALHLTARPILVNNAEAPTIL